MFEAVTNTEIRIFILILHFLLKSRLSHMMISMWAYTATIRAARSDMDIVGCLVVACAACLGGGTFRDAFLGRDYFWVVDPSFLTNIIVSSFATFIAWPFMERSGAQKGEL